MMCVPRSPQDAQDAGHMDTWGWQGSAGIGRTLTRMPQDAPGCRTYGHWGGGRYRQDRQDFEGTRRYQSTNAAREEPSKSKILRVDMHIHMGGLRSCTCAVVRFLASHRDYPLFYKRRRHRVRQTPWFPVNPCHVFSVFGPDPFAGARLAAHGSGRPICQVGPDARRLFVAPPRVALRVFTVADAPHVLS